MKVKILIERDLKLVGPIGECLRSLCDLTQYPENKRLELVVNELLCNVIRHSKPYEGCNNVLPVSLSCIIDDTSLTLTVSELGSPMSDDIVRCYTDSQVRMPSNDFDGSQLPESGWGVQLIKTICDDISYERLGGTNVLHLCFDLNAAV